MFYLYSHNLFQKYFTDAQRIVDQLKMEFETEKEKIIQAAIDDFKSDLELNQSSLKLKSPKNQISQNPVVLNTLAPVNQRFRKSPTLRRKRKLDVTESVKEIYLGNYEIQFVSPNGEVDETQQFYEVEKISEDTEIELIDAEFVDEAEKVSKSEDDEEYKPPVVSKKSRKKRIVKKFKNLPTKAAKKKSKLIKKDVPPESTDDYYFNSIDDACEQDVDENGEKKIFQCAFIDCPEKFARRQACKTHYYNHRTSQSFSNGFKCKFCGKIFKVQSALERHERVHTGDKPFKCDVADCEKSFSQKEMLKRHKIIHLSIEDAPFACTQCDKKFRQKEPLRLHISKTHTDNATTHPFNCSICNKQFAHSSGLSRHFLIHSGRLFSCEVSEVLFFFLPNVVWFYSYKFMG